MNTKKLCKEETKNGSGEEFEILKLVTKATLDQNSKKLDIDMRMREIELEIKRIDAEKEKLLIERDRERDRLLIE